MKIIKPLDVSDDELNYEVGENFDTRHMFTKDERIIALAKKINEIIEELNLVTWEKQQK